MKRRDVAKLIAAAVAGLSAGVVKGADKASGPVDKAAKHVCQGLNECKGQGNCKHGCSGHGCHGKNDCKGKGGCASEAAQHTCAGKNECKGLGGCAASAEGCAAKNSCKGKGGCEVPLPIDHAGARKKKSATAKPQ